jgi:hypothetical protein
MNSAQFDLASHDRKEHGTAKADNEIAEVPSPKFPLSARAHPKNAAIFVQNIGAEHMIDNVFAFF